MEFYSSITEFLINDNATYDTLQEKEIYENLRKAFSKNQAKKTIEEQIQEKLDKALTQALDKIIVKL